MTGDCRIYTVTGSDGSHVNRGFCPVCGSPVISFVEEQPGMRFVKAGSLDDPSWVSPENNYWCESAFSFDPVDQTLLGFPGNPSA